MAVLLVACASDDVARDGSGLPLPHPELAEQAGISMEEMGEGYWVYTRKCVECHAAALPVGDLDGQWHPEVEGMSEVTIADEGAILKYVRAATFGQN